jgi:hypothetical protein
MKRFIFLEILKRIQSKPEYKRKFKIFLLVFSGVFVLTTGFLIWGAIQLTSSAIHFAQNISRDASSSETLLPPPPTDISKVIAPLSSLGTSVGASFGNFNLGQCWGAALSLSDWQVWLQRPLLENFNLLTSQCFPQAQTDCQNQSCEKTVEKRHDEWMRI